MGEGLEYFSKEGTQMANKHVKRWSIASIIIKSKSKPQWNATSHSSEHRK